MDPTLKLWIGILIVLITSGLILLFLGDLILAQGKTTWKILDWIERLIYWALDRIVSFFVGLVALAVLLLMLMFIIHVWGKFEGWFYSTPIPGQINAFMTENSTWILLSILAIAVLWGVIAFGDSLRKGT